jgi:hypothetical protein
MDGVEFAQRGIGRIGTVEKFRRQMFEIDTGDTRGQGTAFVSSPACSIFDTCPMSTRFQQPPAAAITV